jgi:hypothetical protein
MALLKPIAAIAALSIAFLYVAGVATSSDDNEVNDAPRPDVEFTVTKDDSDQHRRRIEVSLAQTISEDQLKSIAEYLRKDGASNTLIGYRIEGDSDYGYWATTNYTPDLSVRVIGTASELGADMEESNQPESSFQIVKDEAEQLKRSVEVVLPDRIDKQQLEALARHIYQDRPGNTFIGYYIEGEGDYAYWATAHYNPELDVQILGSSKAQEQSLNDTSSGLEGDVLGRWRVNRGYNSIITLIEAGGEKRLIQRFQDGSEMDNPAQERNVNGQTRLSDGIGENNGEYYIIGDDGRLQFWSNNGNYYTAPIDR